MHKKGMIKEYKENIRLLNHYDSCYCNVRKYLLTVNVAQQLLEFANNHYCNINLEYLVKYFYNNAFLKEKFVGEKITVENIFNWFKMIRRKEYLPTNELREKIDIVITQKRNDIYLT